MITGYRLTPQASQDIDEIALYTLERWGLNQMRRYVTDLVDRFDWLADHPRAGHDCGDIRPGLQSFTQGTHMVIYRVVDDTLEIVAVLHQSPDIPKHLGSPK